MGNPYYNDYWREFAIDEHYSEMDVPIFHLGGWYDRHVHGTVKHFNEIGTEGGPRARGQQKLYIGPWTHGAALAGRVAHRRHRLRPGRGHRLRRAPKALVRLPPEGNRQRDHGRAAGPDFRDGGEPLAVREAEFPLKRAQSRELFLRAGGLLSNDPPAEETADRYDYDPRKPVPTIGGDLFVEPNGARDHRPAEKLALTYTSAPLERRHRSDRTAEGRALRLFERRRHRLGGDAIGRPSRRLFAVSSTEHSPRAIPRWETRSPCSWSPAKSIASRSRSIRIANLFKAGHRIRLTVASSSFPKWYPNGNTGREINEDFPPVVATNQIFHDREHASRVTLPIGSPR